MPKIFEAREFSVQKGPRLKFSESSLGEYGAINGPIIEITIKNAQTNRPMSAPRFSFKSLKKFAIILAFLSFLDSPKCKGGQQ